MSDLNLKNVFVDKSGRVRFSGAKSGIDFIDVVDKLVKARRTPAVTMKTKIDANETKIKALQELETLVNTLKASLSKLYGKTSFDQSSDIFSAKNVFTRTSRSDSKTASKAGNLVGVSVTNAAKTGTRTLEIEQKAEAQKLSGTAFAGKTTDAVGASGTVTLKTASGQSVDINVLATDSLADIRDRINNTTSNSGISATVVQASDKESYLILKTAKEGLDNRITTLSDTGNVLSTLGLSNSGGITSQTVSGGTLSADLTLTIAGKAFSWASGTNLSDIETDINNAGLTGVTASVASDQLTIKGTSDVHEKSGSIGLKMAGQLQGAQNAILKVDGLNTKVERSTNTIKDLFEGTTLSLFNAEAGTKITIDTAKNAAAVKTAITDFVKNYNELQKFINEKTFVDPKNGKVGKDSVLYGNAAVTSLKNTLQNIFGGVAEGVDLAKGLGVMSAIGLEMEVGAKADKYRERGTIKINETTLNDQLVKNLDGVRKLFAFDFKSDNPNIVMLGFGGGTRHKTGGYDVNLTFDAAKKITNATINGTGMKVSGNSLSAGADSQANGLRLFYNGQGNAPERAKVNFTVGIAAQLNFALESVLDKKTGGLQAEIKNLESQNKQNQERIDSIDTRMKLYRQGLLDGFIAMEKALAQMNSVQKSINALLGIGGKKK